MNMARFVVFRICDKSNAIEPNRAHTPRIRRYLSWNSLFLHGR
jgi:hypothetical protein